jgi:DNA polymerase epsilon subunit 1
LEADARDQDLILSEWNTSNRTCNRCLTRLDIETVKDGPSRIGYLANVKTTTVEIEDEEKFTALICYFYTKTGKWFKAYYRYDPYFYIEIADQFKDEFLGFMDKSFRASYKMMEEVKKINLEDINHMSGSKTTYLKISFVTILV